MRRKELHIPLEPPVDYLDITLDTEQGQVTGFVINYRTKINNKDHVVYRVDNRHGYLHEQKYWLSGKPIRIKTDKPLKIMYDEYFDKLKNCNCWRQYKQLYLNK